ncbi:MULTISPECIES: single-stranded DNA-binding protein [Levilactobacillus]|uniref:Single-stranded DNA-binding protein n=2 Tax=root TaxID=1 RepID=D6PSU2_9CAUD|nr:MULTISPECIES: single-stranded DNA-binding protein [Levilactobacillus]YP_009168558.1 single-stranded DNA-binding protein [Lactobacillus phage LBR48]ADF83433.1 putative single strand binding protein [Lactobacillus phage LBR48]
MRTITISGNVGKDPEVRSTQNGMQVANFSVAVRQNRQSEDGQYGTDWFRCTVWGNRANVIQRFYHKGSHVIVSGDLEITEYNGQTQLGVNVNDFDLPDRQSESQQHNTQQTVPASDSIDVTDDDLPF